MAPLPRPPLLLLEKLCHALAVSGDESEVRAIVQQELAGRADEVRVDALGNVLAIKRATVRPTSGAPLRLMLAAHMDEVGFMLVAEDGDGLFRFETIGNVDVRQLPGRAVIVGSEHIPGVIGARPIHLTTAEERQKTIPLDALRIDLGPEGSKKAQAGDRATFATRFQRHGAVIMGKALDNRLGVALLLELLRTPPPHLDLLAAFTVQEEIGLRGAQVAAYALEPDLAIALDATPANDLPPWDEEENTSYNTRLGCGPAIYLADSATLADPRLVRWLVETAEAEKIPYQFRQPGGGGTDAGAIHKSRHGVPSVSLSVPHRYSHTALSLARLEDWQHTLALLRAALARLTPQVLAGERG
jgi:endoglucanase